jgi:hypothetical protein
VVLLLLAGFEIDQIRKLLINIEQVNDSNYAKFRDN